MALRQALALESSASVCVCVALALRLDPCAVASRSITVASVATPGAARVPGRGAGRHCARVSRRGNYISRPALRALRMRGRLGLAAILKSEPEAGRRRGRSILGSGRWRRGGTGGAARGEGQPRGRGP